MPKTQVSVALIGLNRQTVSLGLALRAYNQKSDNKLQFSLRGQDGDKQKLEAAKTLGAVETTESNARNAVKDADVIIVGLPFSLHVDVMSYFAPALKAGAVVLDLSSNKAEVAKRAREQFPRNEKGQATAYLVGIQPLVANPFLYNAASDVNSADAKLFQKSELIIAPAADCPEEAVKLATDLADILEMQPRFMLPEEYDALADFTEHLPPVLSLALFATLQANSGNLDLQRAVNPALAVMLQSLREMQASDLSAAWTHNPQNTLRHLDSLSHIIDDLRELIAKGDSEEVQHYIKEMLMAFNVWESRREAGRWVESQNPAPSAASVFGSLFSFGPTRRDRRGEN